MATANHLLEPQAKYEQTPVLENFGYLNSMVKVQGRYYLFTTHSVVAVALNYSPFVVATADRVEGPL